MLSAKIKGYWQRGKEYIDERKKIFDFLGIKEAKQMREIVREFKRTDAHAPHPALCKQYDVSEQKLVQLVQSEEDIDKKMQRLEEEARQRELAEKAARAVRRRRAEELRRYAEAERRRREEAKSRERAGREAEQAPPLAEDAERTKPDAAVSDGRPLTDDAHRRLRRARRQAARAQLERLPPDVLARLGQYGITTAGRNRNGDNGADAQNEPEGAPTEDEQSETQ